MLLIAGKLYLEGYDVRGMLGQQRDKVGMVPGSVIYTGPKKIEAVSLDTIWCNETDLDERRNVPLDEGVASALKTQTAG